MRDLAKYRVISKGSLVTIKSKLSRTDKINEREMEYLLNNYTGGLFKVAYDGKKYIEYTAPMATALDKYLKNRVIDENTFWKIIAQIVKCTKTVELCGLYQDNLWLDTNVIFINETTLELYFIYQPLKENGNIGNAFAVISDITYSEIKKHMGMQDDFLVNFQTFLNQGNNYRIEQIQEYLMRVCPAINGIIYDAERGKSGYLTTDPIAYGQHYEKDERTMNSDDTVCLDEQGTVVLGALEEEEYGETTVLEKKNRKCLCLVRKSDESRVAMTGTTFYIGKSSTNDYCITGNSAVSRKHAVISYNDDEYYLSDLGSTNGTLVNGERIDNGIEKKLMDGDEIVLADEEFCIEIK